ncbi:MAG: hypothetical protein R3E42_18390 [Burkholderiaceae bacterium]
MPAIGNPANAGPLGGSPGGGFGWRNINVFKLGVQWEMSPKVTLRAGYNRSDNPVTSANITPNVIAPGVMTSHYTLGATYAMSPTSELTRPDVRAPRAGEWAFHAGRHRVGEHAADLDRASVGMRF